MQWDGFPEAVGKRFRGNARYAESQHLGHEDWFGFDLPDLPIVDVDTGAEVDIDCRVRDRQDEYLEWHAREVDGVLRSITFVCEGYDYYEFLFRQGAQGREHVAQRYRACTGDPSITPEDLEAPASLGFSLPGGRIERFVEKGDFNPRNRFNRENGIVHLSHRANSLAAEVRLAVTSALPRVDANDELVHGGDPKRLLCCTLAGEPSRSSDANIAAGAYLAVTDPEAPQRFTLTDPIGLYIADFAYSSLQHADGEPASRDYWTVTRGKDADPIDDRERVAYLAPAPRDPGGRGCPRHDAHRGVSDRASGAAGRARQDAPARRHLERSGGHRRAADRVYRWLLSRHPDHVARVLRGGGRAAMRRQAPWTPTPTC